MKKYDPVTRTPRYDVGKEIYRFGYDIKAGRLLPQGVSFCSVRGSLGWPDVSHTDRNLDAIAAFYLASYAKALADFAAKHPVSPLADLGERFFAGFEFRLRALEWAFTLQRDAFEDFDPALPPRYGFLPSGASPSGHWSATCGASHPCAQSSSCSWSIRTRPSPCRRTTRARWRT